MIDDLFVYYWDEDTGIMCVVLIQSFSSSSCHECIEQRDGEDGEPAARGKRLSSAHLADR